MDITAAQQGLETLGLSPFASQVFIDLLGHGNSGALDISERTGIARTSVYRAIEELEMRKLVRVDGHKTSHYRAVEYHKLDELVHEHEQRARDIQTMLPELYGFFLNLQGDPSSATSVKYYEGVEGLKQVTLNTLATKGVCRVFEISTLNAFLDEEFAEFIRYETVKRGFTIREVTNHRRRSAFTNIAGYVDKHLQSRYIAANALPIKIETTIYNDTVVLYDYRENPFCVEIVSENLAVMQRGLFDFVWKVARRMTFVDDNGTTVTK
jgi:sugar-specific transcriptional regulator TrmB